MGLHTGDIVAVSRPAEPPRQPLAERYVNLSTHTAPIRQTRLSFHNASEQKELDFSRQSLRDIVLLLSSYV